MNDFCKIWQGRNTPIVFMKDPMLLMAGRIVFQVIPKFRDLVLLASSFVTEVEGIIAAKNVTYLGSNPLPSD